MSSDLDKSQISSEVLENDIISSEISYITDDKNGSSSEIEGSTSSENCSEIESTISSTDNEAVESDKYDTNNSFLCKRNKIDDVKPSAFSTPIGTKSVFGSAAKNIVSFNSIASNPSLPSKSLFAEEISETQKTGMKEESATKKEAESAEYEVITGEEDERTIISKKGKLFEFNAETKDWHERGIGMFKLNKSNKTEKYRIIMRTDGVQKLVLNSNLFPKMICEIVQEKNIRFSAYNFESKIQTFILRMKYSDDASTLESSLKDAIASISTEESC